MPNSLNDQVFSREWFVIAKIHNIIGLNGYPEHYYECYIGTTANPDDPDHHKLAVAVEWPNPHGPGRLTDQEYRLIEHLVTVHNASLYKKEPETVDQALLNYKGKKKIKNHPGKPENLGWPKGLPHLKDEAGNRLKLKAILEMSPEDIEAAKANGNVVRAKEETASETEEA